MTPNGNAKRAIGKAYWLLTVAFALVLVVIALVGHFGVADGVTMVLVVLVTLVAYSAIGIVTRTLSLTEFFVAGRAIPAGVNGLATATAFLSTAGVIGLVGAFFADKTAGLAIAAGWGGGFVVLAVAVAPFYRKSGAVTLPDLLAVRYGNPLIRILGVIVLVASLLPLLAAAIATAGEITGRALSLSPDTALTGMVVVLAIGTVFGGMRAVTMVAGAQAIVVLFGILTPALVFSLERYGMPLPQIAYGDAVGDAAWAAGTPIAVLPSVLVPLSDLDGFNLFALALCIAAGVASLPHVVARSGTVSTMSEARYSVAVALIVVGIVAATAPAIAAFARLAILNDAIGVEVTELPQWVYDHAANGSLTVCGAAVADITEVSAACGAATIVNGLAPGDLAIGGDAISTGFTAFADLPSVLTALIVAAVIAAALGSAGAVTISLGASLGHDVYGSLINRRAPAGRRLAASRLGVIAFIILGTWLATTYRDDVVKLAFAAPSLAAAGFFPALVLGIWWRRTTFWGAITGTVAGFGATGAYVWLLHIGTIRPIGIAGLTESGLSGAAAAFLGVPIGFVVTALVSFVTPAPSPARLQVVNAIRRPSPDPLLEDHAI
ncbi:MAG: hypothetical protein GY798_11575 [Hyphomicrobiales bacterium]|nr:hypothetical protein [Hyphomicrobiales bacterium]